MSYTRDIENDLILDTETGEYIPVPEPEPVVLYTFTIIPQPSDARVELIAEGYEQEGDSITVPTGTLVGYTVSCDGYESFSDSIIVTTDSTVEITLFEIPKYTLTIVPTPEDALVVLTATGYEQEGNSIEVETGTLVNCVVSKEDYITNETNVVITEDQILPIELQEVPDDPYIHIQLLRGTTLKNDEYVGKVGELTYDIEKKNVRVHDGETAGGKIVSADIDDLTIVNDVNEKLQTVAVKNQNRSSGGSEVLYDWEGTLAEYQAQNIETLHPDWLCYINDDVEGGISVYTKTEIDRELVHKTQSETISGYKTFIGSSASDGYSKIAIRDLNPLADTSLTERSQSHNGSMIQFLDKNNEQAGYVYNNYQENGTVRTVLQVNRYLNEQDEHASISVGLENNGTKFANAPTPTSSSNTNHIATTQWVNGNRSNCITEIPQDLKLVIEEGVLKLKAGSKYYVPNGFEEDGTTRHFDIIVTTEDKVAVADTSRTAVHWVWAEGAHIDHPLPAQWCFSGNTAPVPPTWYANKYAFWYDTANNKCKWTDDAGVTWVEGMSLPICIATEKTTEYVNIDQVFNGFGFVGSTVFVLPGVKGLVPNGRNEDGTLKSYVVETKKVSIDNFQYFDSPNSFYVLLYSDGKLGGQIANDNQNCFYVKTRKEMPTANNSWSWCYVEDENIWYRESGHDYWTESHVIYCGNGSLDYNYDNIKSFYSSSVIKTINENDITVLLNTLYPIGSIYLGTQSVCPLTVLLPGSTWEKCPGQHALWISGTGQPAGSTIEAGLPNITGRVSTPRTYEATSNGAFYTKNESVIIAAGTGTDGSKAVYMDASRSSSIYGKSSTVQPPAYVVNAWRRTS